MRFAVENPYHRKVLTLFGITLIYSGFQKFLALGELERGARERGTSLTLSLPSSKSKISKSLKEECISAIVRIGSIIIPHLSKLWKAMFSMLRDVIFLLRLQEKF